MRPEQVDWDCGEVVFWNLYFLDPTKPLTTQTDDLTEDLAQIIYPDLVILDIGWYPEFSEEGGFVVIVAREEKWNEPLFEESHKTIKGFLKCLREAVATATNYGRQS